jgi:type IV pilus assembly protein PilX
MDVRLPNKNERGIALVISMLILLVMTLLGLVLMAGASLNRGLAGNDQRMRQSLNIAEAGVGEAEARIGNQETLMDPADPNDACLVFNTIAGSVPVVGADTIALATGQPVGSYLNYTTATRTPDVLLIGWKKNAAGTQVMRYDAARNPAVQTLSGTPIYTITATGRVGQARRTIVTEVMQRPYIVNAMGAFTANIPIEDLGNAVVCGYDHLASTPINDGIKGRDNPAPIPPNDPKYCHDNESGIAANDRPGVWCGDAIAPGGGSQNFGNPPLLGGQGKNNFYTGPWDALGMSQADWWAFVGAPRDPSTVSDWNGILHLDNNTVTQDGSCQVGPSGVDGEGLLYIDGDLHLNSNFTYKGFIYVEGDIDVNGNAWILGGIVARGKTKIKINGAMTVLYSGDAITQQLTKYGSQFVTLSWREQ